MKIFICASLVCIFVHSVLAGDAIAIGYKYDGVWTAVTYNRSSTPKGCPHYHDAVQACTFAVRDLHVRASDYLVRAEIIGKSDRTGYVAVAQGKAIGKNKDVTAVGRGTSQAEADEKALELLNANGVLPNKNFGGDTVGQSSTVTLPGEAGFHRPPAPRPDAVFLQNYPPELGTNVAQRFDRDPFEQKSPSQTIGEPIRAPLLAFDQTQGLRTGYSSKIIALHKQFGPISAVVYPSASGMTGSVSAAGISMPLPKTVAGEIWDSAMHKPVFKPAEGIKRTPLPDKAPKDSVWINPFGPLTTKAAKASKLSVEASKPYCLLYTYSLIIALVCGTAGLPHILVRFYTNPDGVAAKRTTMWVMILIGVFYLFPPVFGVLGRNLLPELYAGVGAKGTDKIVLELPRLLNERYAPLGSILSGITCAGAFAAFMSTFSGLLVSMTGALAHDVYGKMLRPKSTPDQRMRAFKVCTVVVGGVAILLGMQVEPFQINFMVGQAFAIAAASYFPLLFMSAWWRGMTMKGAATGMLAGGLLALAGISLTSFTDLKWLPLDGFWAAHPLLRILCEQPAIWAVPLAITAFAGCALLSLVLPRTAVPDAYE